MRRRDFLKIGAAGAVLSGCVSGQVPVRRDGGGDLRMRGPFPLLCTPYGADGSLDTVTLVREAHFVDACGAGGVIWPAANEVLGGLSMSEWQSGLEALAAAWKGHRAVLTVCCPGKTSADALERVRFVIRLADRQGLRPALLARPPDDAMTDEAIEQHYTALADLVSTAPAGPFPVMIQTYNGKSPQPSIALLIRLAKKFPRIYGYVKEESPGLKVNGRIVELVAAKPVIHAVFSGWGAKGYLYQGLRLGTDGVVTQRPAYADLLTRIWEDIQNGDARGTLLDAYSRLLLMYNLGDTFAGSDDEMRGPHLAVLMKRGVFVNTFTRKRAPKDSIGGSKWIVSSVSVSKEMSDEIDARLASCAPYLKRNLGQSEKTKTTNRDGK